MNNKGIKYGIIAGVLVILCMLLFYFFDKRWMVGQTISMLSTLIYLVMMFKAAIAQRNSNNGILTFKEGLRTAFVTFLVANICYYIFHYALYNFIDPSLIELQKEAVANLYKLLLEEKAANKMIESAQEIDGVSFSFIFFKYAREAIAGFVLALIVGMLTKRLF